MNSFYVLLTGVAIGIIISGLVVLNVRHYRHMKSMTSEERARYEEESAAEDRCW